MSLDREHDDEHFTTQCPPWKTLLSPLIQLPVFVTLSWGVREIAHSASQPELRTEGMLWFQDLTGSAMYGFLRVRVPLFNPLFVFSILVRLGPNYE